MCNPTRPRFLAAIIVGTLGCIGVWTPVYSQSLPVDESDLRTHLMSVLNANSDAVQTMRVEFDLFRAADVAMSPGELERMLMNGLEARSPETTFSTLTQRLGTPGRIQQSQGCRFIYDGSRRLEHAYGTLTVDDGQGVIRKSDANQQITVGDPAHLQYKILGPIDFRRLMKPDSIATAKHLRTSPAGAILLGEFGEFIIDPETALSRFLGRRNSDGVLNRLHCEVGTLEAAPGIYFAELIVDAAFKDPDTLQLASAIRIKNIAINEVIDESVFKVGAEAGTIHLDVTGGIDPKNAIVIAETDDIREGITRADGQTANRPMLPSPSMSRRSILFGTSAACVALVLIMILVRRLRGASM